MIRAAESGPIVEGVEGQDRSMVYVMAAWTGFRRSELARLTLNDFRLDDDRPTVHLCAHQTKGRRDDAPIPLHAEVVRRFRDWLSRRPSVGKQRPLFPIAQRKTSKMMKIDLAAAGIPYQDASGQFADFHAHRVAFISNLARAVDDFGTVFKLARHADPKLTARVYDHVRSETRAAAIACLPAPPALNSSE